MRGDAAPAARSASEATAMNGPAPPRAGSSGSTSPAAWRCSAWWPRTSSTARDADGVAERRAVAGRRPRLRAVRGAGRGQPRAGHRRAHAVRRPRAVGALRRAGRPGAAGRAARAGPGRARLRAGGDPHLLRRAVPARAAVPRAARAGRCSRSPRSGWCVGAGGLAAGCARTCPSAASTARSPTSWPSPGRLLAELLFTGYYPGVAVAGLPAARAWRSAALDLRRRAVAAGARRSAGWRSR